MPGGMCIALTILLLFSSTDVLARQTAGRVKNISMQIEVGMNATARSGTWLPVQVTVTNESDKDFNGRVVLRTYTGFFRSVQTDDLQQHFERALFYGCACTSDRWSR
jgi:hypothetical protein